MWNIYGEILTPESLLSKRMTLQTVEHDRDSIQWTDVCGREPWRSALIWKGSQQSNVWQVENMQRRSSDDLSVAAFELQSDHTNTD